MSSRPRLGRRSSETGGQNVDNAQSLRNEIELLVSETIQMHGLTAATTLDVSSKATAAKIAIESA